MLVTLKTKFRASVFVDYADFAWGSAPNLDIVDPENWTRPYVSRTLSVAQVRSATVNREYGGR